MAQLSPMLRSSTRSIAALAVKGKGDDVAVCEVIWQGGEELTMATPSILAPARESTLLLRHAGQELLLDQANGSVVMGRDAACQVVVADRMASRQHARLERRRDKFFLVDLSTNGTFVRIAGEAEMVLRREELMLRGQGRIAFGRSADEEGVETADFEVRE